MSKLLASDIIDLDDAFLERIEQRLSQRQKKRQEAKKFYTINEVALLAKTTAQTIRRHIKQGLLKASKKGGKSYLVSQQSLDNYFNPKNNNNDY